MNNSTDVGDRIQDLILLIGYNPMPNYIVTRFLRPKHVHCLHTIGTKGTKEIYFKLKEVLSTEMPDIELTPYPLTDAANPLEIQKSMNDMPSGAHLNYTGGTKAMTANAYEYWRNDLGGDDPSRASYLDGYKGILYFNDGVTRGLEGFSTKIDQVLKLHGLEMERYRYHPDANIKTEDAIKILDAILDLGKKKTIHNAFSSLIKHPTKCRQALNSLPGKYKPDFMKIPGWPVVSGDQKENIRKSWIDFGKGAWFEDFVHRAVRRACPEAKVAIRLKASNTDIIDTEIDLLVLLGYRVCLISCTTSDQIKQKYYEAQNRVALVGGDLAKAAVACLASQETVSRIERNNRVLWQPDRSAVKVFGINDVHAWRKGDYSVLHEWLTE